MKTFRYHAIDLVGRQEKGRMQARSIADLEVRLQQMGLDLTTAKVITKADVLFLIAKHSTATIGHRDLVLFCFQLEQMLNAGVPILEALNDLKEHTKDADFKSILSTILLEVEGGKVLSEALAAHPSTFDPVFIHLIAAGEQSGELPMILNQLGHTLKWQDALLAQAKRLLMYPLFIVVMMMAAIVFLMVFLVPELVKFLDSLGQTLPWNTKLLISISNAFVEYWWLLISMPILLALAFFALIKKRSSARYQWDAAKLKLPMVGDVLNKIILARFSRYFALLYRAGIPILTAIQICKNIVGNQMISEALQAAHDDIRAGQSMRDSFEQTRIFPSLVISMIAVGERSGGLDQALMNVSYFYDRDVDERLQSLLKLLEPALTIALGLVLLFVMTAVLGPVYESFSQMPL